jgi:hypothetical protein
MTQEGGNIKILHSVIDISNVVRVFIVEAKALCSLYNSNWIANNFLIDNCTFKGLNSGGHGSLFYT